MAERFVFHIGTPKSGTTYIQSVLLANHASLLEAGVLVPNSGGVDRVRMRAEIVAGVDTLEAGSLTRRVLDQAAAHPGTVVLSEEWLVRAGADAVAMLVEACRPAVVEVVVTARDFTRLVPTAWQEGLKLGRGYDLDDFVTRLERRRARWSWRTLDPYEATRSWAVHLATDRIHVVTVPPSDADPDLLWHRFCEAAAIPAAAATLPRTHANQTLGVVAARLMQEVGPSLASAVLRDDDDNNARYRWLQGYVSQNVLAALSREPIALGPEDHAAVRERAEQAVRSIHTAGWHLVGDLREIVGDATPRGRHPSTVTPEELVAVVGPVLGRVVHDLRVAREPVPRS